MIEEKGYIRKILINKSTIHAYIFFIFTFLTSIFITNFYILGDQFHYIEFYESSKDLSLLDTYILQLTSIGSADPGYSLIIWLFSDLVSKNLLISLANALLALLLFKILRNFKYPTWFFVGMLLSFYMFVLFFAAERLKFAAIVILVAFFYKNFFTRAFIILLASLFHAQSLFALALIGIHAVTRKNLLPNIFKFGNFLAFIFIASFISIFLMFAYELIYEKFIAYTSYDFLSLAKPIALGSISLIFMRDKFFALSCFIFFLVTCFILGTDRIIMMQFIFTMLFLDHRDKNQVLVLSTLFLYLFLKNLDFIYKIFLCGEGFLCTAY